MSDAAAKVTRGRASHACFAVASACIAAERIREARAGESRRTLAKRAGITAKDLERFEDCSGIPTQAQWKALCSHLGLREVDHFAPARTFDRPPWEHALREVLPNGTSCKAHTLAKQIAETASECKTPWVKWRLDRALHMLLVAGIVSHTPDGAWRIQDHGLESVRRPPHASRVEHRRSDELRSRHEPEQDALFHVETTPGHRAIVLNRCHPLFASLDAVLSGASDTASENALRSRLALASSLINDLFAAWAAYEESEKSGGRQARAREARQAWGREARRLALSRVDALRNDPE